MSSQPNASEQKTEFETEAAPLSTSSANARPNEIAEVDAQSEDFSRETAALTSNGANAAAEKTPGEILSRGEK